MRNRTDQWSRGDGCDKTSYASNRPPRSLCRATGMASGMGMDMDMGMALGVVAESTNPQIR